MHPKHTPNVNCDECGIAFYRKPSCIRARNFCSVTCMNRGVDCLCEVCGAHFTIKRSHAQRPGRGRFCSLDCSKLARATGMVVGGRKTDPPLATRFFAKVDKDSNAPCWEWTAHRTPKGYGSISVQGKSCAAHRVSWEIVNGPIPTGMHVLHRCDNPGCVNPEHLFLGTNSDNVEDKVSKSRQARGEHSGRAILTEVQVLEIRARYLWYKVTARMLAEEFGVAEQTIRGVLSGRNWEHV